MPLKAHRTLTAASLCLVWAACGDDDTPKGPSDASVDAAVDSGTIFIPRRDASVAPSDPIRECDRFTPNSCPSGQTCDVLVRQFAANPEELLIYTGCVDNARERGLGDPCDPEFYTSSPPYQTEGLTDLVFRDQCGPGLICADDPEVRGGTSCQPACSTGQFLENPTLCEDPNSFCVGRGAFLEYCRKTEGCDVVTQTGCREGFACYLRPRDDLSGFMTMCLPPSEMRVADGQPCMFYNSCRPGSSCNGPLRTPLSRWDDSVMLCRPTCNADGSLAGEVDSDGGVDDGGTSSGGLCSAPQSCAPFSQTGLSLSGIAKPPYGQCE